MFSDLLEALKPLLSPEIYLMLTSQPSISIKYLTIYRKVEITPWPVSGSRKLYPGTGAMAGIMGGEFVYTWEGDVCKALDDDDANHYITGRLPADMKYDNRTYVA
jgi:hypothetical protein